MKFDISGGSSPSAVLVVKADGTAGNLSCFPSPDSNSCLYLKETILRYTDADGAGYLKESSGFPNYDCLSYENCSNALLALWAVIYTDSADMSQFQSSTRAVYAKHSENDIRGTEWKIRGDIKSDLFKIQVNYFSDYFETDVSSDHLPAESSYLHGISSEGICLRISTMKRVQIEDCSELTFYPLPPTKEVDCPGRTGEQYCSANSLKAKLINPDLINNIP